MIRTMALALLALASAGSLQAADVVVGQVAPNFVFEKVWNATDGQTQLDDYRGKLTVVDAWATW